MENYIVAAILALAVGVAIFYIVKAKKSGKKCIGCPYADSCGKSGDALAANRDSRQTSSFLTPFHKCLTKSRFRYAEPAAGFCFRKKP